jgi:hypothetical protein
VKKRREKKRIKTGQFRIRKRSENKIQNKPNGGNTLFGLRGVLGEESRRETWVRGGIDKGLRLD